MPTSVLAYTGLVDLEAVRSLEQPDYSSELLVYKYPTLHMRLFGGYRSLQKQLSWGFLSSHVVQLGDT